MDLRQSVGNSFEEFISIEIRREKKIRHAREIGIQWACVKGNGCEVGEITAY